MLSNTQNATIIKTGKDLKISKNRFNRYGGQVGSCAGENNISSVSNVGQIDIGQLRCRTSGSSKFSDKYDRGPATPEWLLKWVHIKDYLATSK